MAATPSTATLNIMNPRKPAISVRICMARPLVSKALFFGLLPAQYRFQTHASSGPYMRVPAISQQSLADQNHILQVYSKHTNFECRSISYWRI